MSKNIKCLMKVECNGKKEDFIADEEFYGWMKKGGADLSIYTGLPVVYAEIVKKALSYPLEELVVLHTDEICREYLERVRVVFSHKLTNSHGELILRISHEDSNNDLIAYEAVVNPIDLTFNSIEYFSGDPVIYN